jgi:hypothetical protein
MPDKPAVLYHFTCAHGRKDIGTSNCLLLPNLHPWLGVKLVWLTTEANPDRRKTGLTMEHQPCDRMAFRYVVSSMESCRTWLDSAERAKLDADQLDAFEDSGEAAPDQWWISSQPLRARLDRSYQT